MSLIYGRARRYKALDGPLSIGRGISHRRADNAAGAGVVRFSAILGLTSAALWITWVVARAVDMALAINFGPR